MPTLEQAVARIRNGDIGAFRELVDETSPRLCRLAARIMGSVADGEDVVQDAYIKAYGALMQGRFDGRSHIHTWLYRIVTNTAITALRSRARQRRVTDDPATPVPGNPNSPETHLAVSEIAEWMGALPPEQRVTLVLKTLEGLTSGEIAAIMDCSEGAVEQRLVRARAKLRERQRYHD